MVSVSTAQPGRAPGWVGRASGAQGGGKVGVLGAGGKLIKREVVSNSSWECAAHAP